MNLRPKKEAMKNNIIASSPFRFAFIRFLDGDLHFLNGNGAGRTDFHAAFAAQALIHVHGFGFPVLHLEHADRAGVYALTLPVAFVLVHGHLIHSSFFTSLYGFKAFSSSVMIILL
jgi:hypothetical protein